MFWNICCGLISFTWFVLEVNGQVYPPPIVRTEQRWQIFESDPVGTKVNQAHATGNPGRTLTYGIEPLMSEGDEKPPKKLPFRIDSRTGAIYLNESVQGRGGEHLRLYVTVSEGDLPTKFEVAAYILKASTADSPPENNKNRFKIPGFPPRPEYEQRPPLVPNNPPPQIRNYPPPEPLFHPKPSTSTYLRPVKLEPKEVKNDINEDETREQETTTVKNATDVPSTQNYDENKFDQAVKSPPDIAVTVVPIISVCAVFLMVGVIAVVFRKKIHLGKPKGSKDDIRKPSSGGIVLHEEPAIGMQQWRGPIAFNNRYELWEREVNRSQASHQISAPIKDVDRWEFPRHRLKFFNILGEGAFGQVWKCEAIDIDGKEGISVVAVKTLKENANEKEKSDLLSELQVMKMLEPHPNVVRLLGCCTDKEPIFLIMEYISKGKLQSYLRNSRAERYYNNMHGQSKSLTSRDLTSFVYQVAKGMEFLSANGVSINKPFIHYY
ncbi:hypothetical protein Zmor_027142 [Zophobas morio]|uniref:Protein kinase domain-containing protein n=1 Tax=Zophobas morio TaxID=2755281 RepID=A0AA38HPC3_9CUCU|nr:hypothetical protein Zmor_027142 [Zophobas morio]